MLPRHSKFYGAQMFVFNPLQLIYMICPQDIQGSPSTFIYTSFSTTIYE